MRSIGSRTLLAAAALAMMASGAASAQAQSLMQGRPPAPHGNPAGAAQFREPQFDATAAMIAYHRLHGSLPDFAPYAERSQAYQRATAFDREQVRAKEMTRLEAEFRRFDTTQPFLARLSTTLNQYDMTRRGYAIPLNENSFVGFYDSVSSRQYGVQFRNPDEANFIGIPDVAAARSFAQRNALDMQNTIAASVVLELVFRMVEVAPDVTNGPLLIRADIVAARVMKGKAVMHEFRIAPPMPAPQPDMVVSSGLKAADIQGLTIGMPQPEAEALAAKAYASGASRQADGVIGYFEGLREGSSPLCGVERGAGMPAQTRDGAPTFFTVPDRSAACLAFQAEPPRAGAPGIVWRVVSGQRLEMASRDQVRAALADKYGPPGAVLEGGTLLTWKGTDPARPDAPPVQINARIQESGTGALKALLLGIELRSAAPSEPPRGAGRSGGPRL